MFPRSSTAANDRLRRVKSAAAVQNRATAASDPFAVRRNAETAASQAYRNAMPVEQAVCPDYRPAAAPKLQRRRSQVTGRSEGSFLEDARLGRRRSTIKREDKKTPATGQANNALPASSLTRTGPSQGVAGNATRPSNQPSLPYAIPPGRQPSTAIRARQAASGYRSGSPVARSSSIAPSSSLRPTPRGTDRSYDEGVSVTYTEPRTYAERSKAMPLPAPRRVSIRETQTDDEILALARDGHLLNSQQQRVRERKSFFGSLQKMSRRSDIVPTASTNGITYDSSLPPFNYAEDVPLPPPHDENPPLDLLEVDRKTDRKTRLFSGSVKVHLKKLIRKASRHPTGLPIQHVEAKHLHYSVTEGLATPQPLSNDDPFIVTGPAISTTNPHRDPNANSSSDSSNTTPNDSASAAAKSRVTSWTNSTAAGTTATSSTYAWNQPLGGHVTSNVDEHGRLQRKGSAMTLRKKGSFFGRSVQNRLRKTSRSELKSGDAGLRLFEALRERIRPSEGGEGEEQHVGEGEGPPGAPQGGIDSLPSRSRAAGGGSSSDCAWQTTIRAVTPDKDAFKAQIMSPVVEASPELDPLKHNVDDRTPTTSFPIMTRRNTNPPASAEPPSQEQIARRVQQSQARWQSALHPASGLVEGSRLTTYADDNPYILPSLDPNRYIDNGLPHHSRIAEPSFPTKEGYLSPSIYSRATDAVSPRPLTPEEGGMVVTITGREVKRYEISPSKQADNGDAGKQVQASGEWRAWLASEIGGLDEPTPEPHRAQPDAVKDSGSAVATKRPQSEVRVPSDDSSGNHASSSSTHEHRWKAKRDSRTGTSSRRSSYMNERYPMVESSRASSRQSQRTSRVLSRASTAGTANDGATNSAGSNKVAPPEPMVDHNQSVAKRSSISQPTTHPSIPARPSTKATKSALDLRAHYKPTNPPANRPLDIHVLRRPASQLQTRTSSPALRVGPGMGMGEADDTILKISAGPYADKENVSPSPIPPAASADGRSGVGGAGLVDVSSAEWLGCTTAGAEGARKGVVRDREGRERRGGGGSPGQRLVTGWLRGRPWTGEGNGERAFV